MAKFWPNMGSARNNLGLTYGWSLQGGWSDRLTEEKSSPHSATLVPLPVPSRPVQRKTRTTADSLLTSAWGAHDRRPGCCLSTPEWYYEAHAGSFLRSVIWIPDQPRALEDLVSSRRVLLLSHFFADFRWGFFQDWPFGKTSMVIIWISRVIC